MIEEVVLYIKSQTEKGYDKASITKNLISAGWKSSDIESSFEKVGIVAESVNIELTPEQLFFVKGWSFAALVLAPFFGLYYFASRVKKWGWVSVIPVANIFTAIFGFFHGRNMAWNTGKWSSFSIFESRQRFLDRFALGFFLVITFIVTLVVGTVALYPDELVRIDVETTSELFLDDIINNDIDEAYSKTSEDFKEITSLKDFTGLVSDIGLYDYELTQFDYYATSSIICGSVALNEEYGVIPINIYLSNIDNNWMIDGFDYKDKSCRVYIDSGTEELIGDLPEQISSYAPENVGSFKKRKIDKYDGEFTFDDAYNVFYSNQDYDSGGFVTILVGSVSGEMYSKTFKEMQDYHKSLEEKTEKAVDGVYKGVKYSVIDSNSDKEDYPLGLVLLSDKNAGVLIYITFFNGTKTDLTYVTNEQYKKIKKDFIENYIDSYLK